MPIKAVTLDAYGTLVRSENLVTVPHRIVADHALSAPVEDVFRVWVDHYYRATQGPVFRTLRDIECEALEGVLRYFGVQADPAPYVELFFRLTTDVELYPETLPVLNALPSVRSAVISNADHEHLAAWNFTLPVEFIVISEAVRAYKPDRRMFQHALDRLEVEPHEVLHVGDSDVDDVAGAKAAGLRVAWVNRDGRPRRAGTPPPDFEIRDLTGLPTLL